MISIFGRLSKKQEETGIPFQTAPIGDSPNASHRLAFITAVIERHYLDSSWVCRLNKGSITFQHTINPRWVVKVFIDEGNRLARKLYPSIHPEPIVIGVDLTDKSPFERTAIRQHLRSHFDFYIDPEAGGNKIWVQPDNHHWFDVMFLKQGDCDFPVDEQRVDELRRAFEGEEPLLDDTGATSDAGVTIGASDGRPNAT